MTRLKRERLKRKWSLQELGYRARVQAPELSRFERRLAVPYPGQLERLARALGLSESELLLEVPEHDLQEVGS